ncbi:YceI-like domain-containing protein [Lutibacter sp. Hel_I_33_5]|uniref:YceI family protein n=1 Tax=Lutibacter sp. Hel_I_33_5 TaxID=1566289 RepID=UPI0011A16F04|nr:YceI family protein [Lutibacter sp. Hel_I_33_5]TVZ56661.1 YceI-like domain-containing protein [Lutibacter sp. Hel_I_33_5]
MKKILFSLLFLVSMSVSAQKFFTKTGTTQFKASVEAFEAVEATNKSTSVVLKTDTGEIAALLFMKAFRFRVALMQEHFNENYMDSNKHPKATFRGKIVDYDIDNINNNKKIKGTLTIRGVKKEIEADATFSKSGDKILLKANFSVKPQDFEIDIPSVVRKKIAKSININLDYELVEKK